MGRHEEKPAIGKLSANFHNLNAHLRAAGEACALEGPERSSMPPRSPSSRKPCGRALRVLDERLDAAAPIEGGRDGRMAPPGSNKELAQSRKSSPFGRSCSCHACNSILED